MKLINDCNLWLQWNETNYYLSFDAHNTIFPQFLCQFTSMTDKPWSGMCITFYLNSHKYANKQVPLVSQYGQVLLMFDIKVPEKFCKNDMHEFYKNI